ncbi:SusC/RagA family TonB-linked outer membrane protein [Maribacter polysaccharolyticus]|uniref:SusC/RagA family TonB-linked outer membrane protein n=1 Tax=Maribacter polysaccharolyticus TaxID=3020831 RepID=UPI00237F204A|nr:SusC/RagA family TonB-linked outer membrane protein [Maribacter polysaccharolyticus]MDE3742773.1 SusC/RagA family TonB-linked outer membrane protein [Maribacter polysaccharolyticus]
MEIKLTKVFFFLRKKLLKIIMRTFIFLLCSTVFSFSPVNVLSQNLKIKIPEDKTLTVDQVFDMIKEQTDFRFIYRSDIFKNYPKVNVKKGVMKANRLLEKSLSKGNFKFNISANNTITIRKASAVQELEISGIVTDENGLPIPGITVYISSREPGSGPINSDFYIRGTATDFNGEFKITGEVGYYLIATGLGFEYFKAQITPGQTIYNISLKESVSELDEVVVISSGFQEISKERATGAYVGVKKDLINKPASSISERIIGAVAGVQSTVAADGSVSFQIRGLSSLVANADPLIVLDGFPIEGAFETINPNDVESITVLKDAAAASIWGAKAANGVIVVESKKVKKQKTNVSISTFVRTSSKLDLDYVLARGSSADYLEYEQAAFDTNFFGDYFGPPSISATQVSSPYSQAIVAMNEARLGRITEAERDATLATLAGLDNSDQIRDYLLATPLTAQYNISISGGNEKMANSLSLLFENKNSYFIGDDTKEYQVNFKNQTQLAKGLKLDFGAMLQYSDVTANSGDMLNVIKGLSPWDMLKNEDGSLTDMSYLNYYMPNFNEFVPSELFPYSDWSYNPITEVQNRDLNTKQLNTRINAGLTVDIIDGLQLSSKIQYELFNTKNRDYYNDETYAVRKFVNETSGPEWRTGDVPTQLVPSGDILNLSSSEVNAYNWRNQLNFNRTFSEKHHVDVLLGSELSNRTAKATINPASFGYNPETLISSDLLEDRDTHRLWNNLPATYAGYFHSFGLSFQHYFSETTTRLFSLYGNLAYTFDDKYVVTGSYRTDAANIISENPALRYDPFWSGGLGWHLGKENFMEGASWLDKIYLRTTYGSGGNIIPNSSFTPIISLGSSLDLVTEQLTATVIDEGNPDLRWERTTSLNIGVDFSTFKGRLYGSIDIYNKKGEDLIVDQATSGVYGTTSQRLNKGEMVNKGIELSIGTSLPIKGNDIVWSGTFNYSHNDNEITEFNKLVYGSTELSIGPTTSYVEGYNANELWSFEYAGLYDAGGGVMAPSVYGEDGSNIDLNLGAGGNPLDYMIAGGTTNAPTILGVRNAFKIYDFDFSFIFTGKFGHVFRRQGFNYDDLSNGNSYVNEKFSEVANGDPNEILPYPSTGGVSRYYFYSVYYPYLSYLTENASHIRLQEVNLTYNLPKSITNKLGINSWSLFAQANNLGVILFNDFGEDPEYPKESLRPQATFTLGMNLNF